MTRSIRRFDVGLRLSARLIWAGDATATFKGTFPFTPATYTMTVLPAAGLLLDTVARLMGTSLQPGTASRFRAAHIVRSARRLGTGPRAVSQVIDDPGLHDHGILLEYQLPMWSSRLDCMITGPDEARRDNAVILELKRWETCGDVLFSDRFRSILDASPVFTADDRSGFCLDEDPDPSWAGPAVSAFVRIQRAVVGGASK